MFAEITRRFAVHYKSVSGAELLEKSTGPVAVSALAVFDAALLYRMNCTPKECALFIGIGLATFAIFALMTKWK